MRQENYFKPAVDRANAVASTAASHQTAYTEAKTKFGKTAKVEQSLVPSQEARVRWLELIKLISVCLPRNEDPAKRPDKIEDREEIQITSIVARHVDNLAEWYTGVQPMMEQAAPAAQPGAVPGAMPDPNAQQPMPGAAPNPNAGMAGGMVDPNAAAAGGPTGPGWIVELVGHHFHNRKEAPARSADLYVKSTLIKNLSSEKVSIPPAERVQGEASEFDLKKLGVGFPVIVGHSMDWNNVVIDPTGGDEGQQAMGPGGIALPAGSKPLPQPRFDFRLQFCWQDAPAGTTPPASADGTTAAVPPTVPGAAPVAPRGAPSLTACCSGRNDASGRTATPDASAGWSASRRAFGCSSARRGTADAHGAVARSATIASNRSPDGAAGRHGAGCAARTRCATDYRTHVDRVKDGES